MAGLGCTVTLKQYERLKGATGTGTTATKGEKAMSRNEKDGR